MKGKPGELKGFDEQEELVDDSFNGMGIKDFVEQDVDLFKDLVEGIKKEVRIS